MITVRTETKRTSFPAAYPDTSSFNQQSPVPLLLGKRIHYLNAVEHFVTSIETQIIAAYNAAHIIAQSPSQPGLH